jgi:hydroxyacylglutathione hydrolase
MSLTVKVFTFNPFSQNMCVISDEDKNSVIIDPGCYDRAEQNELLRYISDNQLVPLALLNTHAHLDHVVGNAFIQRQFQLDLYLHGADLPTLLHAPMAAHLYGIPGFEPSPEPNHLLKHGDILKFGGIELEVLFAPGHSPGHVVFYNKENHFVINGDVLFQGSFGRYDLPGGDLPTLIRSIKEVLFSLPDETLVYCGHGPTTTIGAEKRSNPILNY